MKISINCEKILIKSVSLLPFCVIDTVMFAREEDCNNIYVRSNTVYCKGCDRAMGVCTELNGILVLNNIRRKTFQPYIMNIDGDRRVQFTKVIDSRGLKRKGTNIEELAPPEKRFCPETDVLCYRYAEPVAPVDFGGETSPEVGLIDFDVFSYSSSPIQIPDYEYFNYHYGSIESDDDDAHGELDWDSVADFWNRSEDESALIFWNRVDQHLALQPEDESYFGPMSPQSPPAPITPPETPPVPNMAHYEADYGSEDGSGAITPEPEVESLASVGGYDFLDFRTGIIYEESFVDEYFDFLNEYLGLE